MRLKFYNVPAKFKLDELKLAANFYAEQLMHKNLIKNLEIRVCFSKNDGNTTMWEDCNLRPREFTITLETGVSLEDTLITLAHEMVHVKQYAKGELFDYVSGGPYMMRWRDEKRNWDDIDYMNFPWEIEAYGRERELYVKFRSFFAK